MKKFLFIVAVSFFPLCSLSYAQNENVIDDELQLTIEKTEEELISINIILKSQPEPSRMKSTGDVIKDRNLQRAFVVKNLKEQSHKKQAGLLELLRDAEVRGAVSLPLDS